MRILASRVLKSCSHALLVGALASVALSCGDTGGGAHSDAAPISDFDARAAYIIGGSATGLGAGDELVLLLNDEQAVTLTTDGDFEFSEGLADEASFTVQPLVNPDGKNCVVADGTGVVAGAAVDTVAVHCTVATTQLASIDVTPFFPAEAVLTPSFSPNTLRYSLSLPYLIDEVSFTLVTEDATATVFVNGLEVDNGTASAFATLAPGSNQVTARVQSTTGESQLYFIDVQREQPQALEVEFPSNGLAIEGDVAVLALPVDSETGPVGNDDLGGLYVYRRESGVWVLDTFIQASESTVGLGDSNRIILKDDVILACNDRADDPNSGESRGAVYVFRQTGGDWLEEDVLRASNGGSNDSFGADASIEGDTIVVGAPGESSSAIGGPVDNSVSSAGAAYIFQRTNGVWGEEHILKASNAGPSDDFGSSVAIRGDLIAIGAGGENSLGAGIDGDKEEPGPSDVGAVYLFELANETWQEAVYVKTLEPLETRRFGHRVELRDSLLVVGADFDQSDRVGINGVPTAGFSRQRSGAVITFRKVAGSWSQEAYIKASNRQGDTFFACDLSLSPDGNTLVVGSHGERSHATGISATSHQDVGAAGAGAVYIFGFRDGAWHEDKFVKVPVFDPEITRFGFSVAYDDGALLIKGNRTVHFY